MARHLTIQQRQLARKLRREGKSVREIAVAIGCSLRTVKRLTHGPGRHESARVVWSPAAGHLSVAEREEISRGLCVGDSLRTIAGRLKRAPSTISREVVANGGHAGYRAVKAHHRAHDRSRRPKQPKLGAGPLLATVERWLEQWWSPQEIARRLRLEYPEILFQY